MLDRLQSAWDWLTPTDGPGYTDHPRTDIKTHRQRARITSALGFVGALALVVSADYSTVSGTRVGFWAIGVVMVTQWLSFGDRLQALRWELELELLDEDDDQEA